MTAVFVIIAVIDIIIIPYGGFFDFLVFFFFLLFRTVPGAHGGSQARGLIRAVATSLQHSHSNAGSELGLRPTAQLTTPQDP